MNEFKELPAKPGGTLKLYLVPLILHCSLKNGSGLFLSSGQSSEFFVC